MQAGSASSSLAPELNRSMHSLNRMKKISFFFLIPTPHPTRQFSEKERIYRGRVGNLGLVGCVDGGQSAIKVWLTSCRVESGAWVVFPHYYAHVFAPEVGVGCG